MEKNRYKLRSSLKKARPKNADDVDQTSEADATFMPPPRRVSFAASNYVKPFIDDPEKNTIWDNTYEEQVSDQTSSLKHVDMSKALPTEETVCDKENIYVNFVSHQESQWNLTSGNNETTCGQNKKMSDTVYVEEDLEFTCHFKNDILMKKVNRTNFNDSGMELTCKFDAAPSILTKQIYNSEIRNDTVDFTCNWSQAPRDINVENTLSGKENIPVNKSKFMQDQIRNHTVVGDVSMDLTLQPNSLTQHFGVSNFEQTCNNDASMEFTCQFNTIQVDEKQRNNAINQLGSHTITINENMHIPLNPSNSKSFYNVHSEENSKLYQNRQLGGTAKSEILTKSTENQNDEFGKQESSSDMEFSRIEADQAHRNEKMNILHQIPFISDLTEQSVDLTSVERTKNYSVKDTETNSIQTPLTLAHKEKTFKIQTFGGTSFTNIQVEAIDLSSRSQQQISHKNPADILTRGMSALLKNKTISVSEMNKASCSTYKTKMFGGIPIATDVTDQSIELSENPKKRIENNGNLPAKPVSEITNASCSTYKTKMFGGIPIATDVTNQSIEQFEYPKKKIENTVDLSANLMSEINKTSCSTYKTKMFGGILIATDVTDQSIEISENPKKRIENTGNLLAKPVSEMNNASCSTYKTKMFGGIPIATDVTDQTIELSESPRMRIENTTVLAAKPREQEDMEITQYSMTQMDDSICEGECRLVDSLPSLDERDIQYLSYHHNLKQDSITEDFSLTKSIPVNENELKDKQQPKHTNKVIYSEPKVSMPSSAHGSDRYTSLESSGLNPFNFNSILCVNDTQQFIQATFAKSSFQEMEEEKDVSLASPTANITIPTTSLSDTFKAQNILRDIQTQLMVVDFEPLEPLLEQVKSTTQDMQQTCADVEKFINDFETLDIDKFILKPKKRKESLGHITIDSSYSNTFNETDEDIKLLSVDSMKSLSENIADMCSRSKHVLRLEHSEGGNYIFEACYDLLVIMVQIHPEDNRVTDIMCESCVKESAGTIVHFGVHNIQQKLDASKLKSYLGTYYDIISLLHYISMAVEESLKFQAEFLKLQEQHTTLKIAKDFSISFDVLCIKPPIWWRICTKLSASNKIQWDELTAEARSGKVNQDHIRQLARDTEEGLTSFRTFIDSVHDYFKRTQLRQ